MGHASNEVDLLFCRGPRDHARRVHRLSARRPPGAAIGVRFFSRGDGMGSGRLRRCPGVGAELVFCRVPGREPRLCAGDSARGALCRADSHHPGKSRLSDRGPRHAGERRPNATGSAQVCKRETHPRQRRDGLPRSKKPARIELRLLCALPRRRGHRSWSPGPPGTRHLVAVASCQGTRARHRACCPGIMAVGVLRGTPLVISGRLACRASRYVEPLWAGSNCDRARCDPRHR